MKFTTLLVLLLVASVLFFPAQILAHVDNLKFLLAQYSLDYPPFDYNSDGKVNIIDASIDAIHVHPSFEPVPTPSPDTSGTWPTLTLTTYIMGFTDPVEITSARDGSNRLFIVEQGGKIFIVKNAASLPTPFLDVSAKVSCCGERGLLGLAFPPNYAVRKRFYVYYTDINGNTVVSRYWVGDNPDVADPTREDIIFQTNQPFANHNGGHIAFGPDGYLYIGLGDGGSGGDPGNRAQNKLQHLGKMLRIDPESVVSGYAVPATNPFISDASYKPEIWALGLRNPWKFSFDRFTGDLWIGDVGQDVNEEVNFEPAGIGGRNYGWRIMEGLSCYNPATGCNQTGLTLPVAQHTHAEGCSVTGGYVYRGETYQSMKGIYFFGDYCGGRIWGLKKNGTEWEKRELYFNNQSLTAFGEDEAGELYVNGYGSGRIYKITATN